MLLGNVDKGTAITAFMARPEYHGRQAVFIGDDTTDEHGFRAINHLGGIAVKVGDLAGSAARFALDDVADVHRWLGALLDRTPCPNL